MYEEVDEFLAHHGIKGMKWGVRKDRPASDSPHDSGSHQKLKTAGIILGTAAAAALIAAGTIYLAKNGKLPISSFSSADKVTGKKFVEEVLAPSERVTRIVHLTGAGNLADRVRSTGGLRDTFSEAQRAGLVDRYAEQVGPGHYRRYGARLEKVAVSFADPQGRKDFSGRPIIHRIILPEQHASGITNHEQAVRRAWELVKDQYEKFSEYAQLRDATNAEARRRGLMD